MKRPFSLSIFFPSYNEEDNIAQSVREADTVAQRITDTYEIIVVDDGSKDKTGSIADRLAREYPNVRVVHHNPNKGAGAAVKSGIAAARYDYVFYTDADLQFDLNELEHLTDYLPEYDIVLGYRAPRKDPALRVFNAWAWNKLNQFVFGLKVRDVDCAFKIYKREIIQNVPIYSGGAMVFAETLIRVQRAGHKWKEVPVTHKPRHAGEQTGANIKVIMRAFRELVYLYSHDLGGPHAVTTLQVAKYAAVGVLNTAIDIAGYIALTRLVPYFGAHELIAKASSFFFATIFSFLINRRWTFGKETPVRTEEVVRFYSTIGVNLFVNVWGLYFFHSVLGMYDLLAVAIATVLTFSIGFVLAKMWVFKNTEQEYGKVVPRGYLTK